MIDTDLKGPAGRAWNPSLEPVTEHLKKLGKWDTAHAAGLDQWVVEIPGAHPLWSVYAVLLIHLRPIEDTLPVNFYKSKSDTHELMLFALSPDKPVEEILTGMHLPLPILAPPNFLGQFEASSDEDAKVFTKDIVRQLVKGTLHPDTDFRFQWKAILPNNPYG